ncbi:MAG: adenylate kinase [Clostridia bacterium]|nr:adenylate kinase [Clostridia bacterium]
MNIILLGAPGAGKGTQASMIAKNYDLTHISTGDIFRENIKNQTEIGVIAKSYIDKGQLVPDEVTCEIVKERLSESDCQDGYLLDGFPRTIMQAETLSTLSKVDLVINIDVDFSILLERLCGRRVCKNCGENYHISKLNGETRCARCGGELYQRKDDNPETVQKRVEVYKAQTAPLIDYYTKRGLLFNVESKTTPEDVYKKISAKLDTLK